AFCCHVQCRYSDPYRKLRSKQHRVPIYEIRKRLESSGHSIAVCRVGVCRTWLCSLSHGRQSLSDVRRTILAHGDKNPLSISATEVRISSRIKIKAGITAMLKSNLHMKYILVR